MQSYSAQDALGLAELSPRAREIVRWVRIGKSNREIASIAGLSENTVKHHLTHIFDRLGVDTRSQLIARLAEHELRVAPGYVTRIL
jgi:DNA-binding CsgD family transcriptional regulator